MLLEGLTVPLITPLNEDETLDERALEHIVEYVISGGADALFVLGTAGEFVNLSVPIKERIVKLVKKQIGDRVKYLVGIAQPSTRATIEEGKRMEALVEADAFVVMAPYYFIHSQSELVTHFMTIASALKTPLVVYNIPVFVHNRIKPEALVRIAENPQFIGIKHSDTDMDALDKFVEIRNAHSATFRVSQGLLSHATEALMRGADGITMGLGSLAPQLCKEMYLAGRMGNRKKAEAINRRLSRLDPEGHSKSWTAGLKYEASLLGLCKPIVTRPFDALDEKDIAIIRQKMADANLLSPESHIKSR